MPLVFCELALAYPPAKVSDPNQRIAAANGQFLLVEREAYRRIGGHPAVPTRCWRMWNWLLLAKAAQGRPSLSLRRRCGSPRACTVQHGAMIEGWTKNLALLFNNALALSLWRALDIVPSLRASRAWRSSSGTPTSPRIRSSGWGPAGSCCCSGCATLFRFYARVAKSNFPLCRLRHFAPGPCRSSCSALSKLVSAPRFEAGKLEGTEPIRADGVSGRKTASCSCKTGLSECKNSL